MLKHTNRNRNRNKLKKTLKFKKLNCAPNREKSISSELQKMSCYNNSELFNFKKYGILKIQII